MPQLMPLYWILSSVMFIFMFIMIMKVYGNYLIKFNLFNDSEINMYIMEKWYW